MTPFHDIYGGKRILLTGHTGFKGAWLSLWLHRLGAEVTGLSIDIPTNPSLFEIAQVSGVVDHRFGDVRNAKAMNDLVAEVRPDVVFHLAAQPLVRRSYVEPMETLSTNVMGTANVLEAVRTTRRRCSVVVVTSDKCYENDGRCAGYRETDPMGGHDPYSMSKGAAELVVASWRNSYFAAPDCDVRVASGRAGNVIGGGDWAADRIVTDCIAALAKRAAIGVRNPHATRPWQHVLEPLSGYLWLGALLMRGDRVDDGWNFGPDENNIRNVEALVRQLITAWGSGEIANHIEADAPKEAFALSLNIDKARAELGWVPVWEFDRTIAEVGRWYRAWLAGAHDMRAFTLAQIADYEQDAATRNIAWAA